MATRPIDMTNATRPGGVEGRMISTEIVYDSAEDKFKISQVNIWMDFKATDSDDAEVYGYAKKLTIGDGMIARAVDKAYSVALTEEIAAQKAANPEYSDEEATDAAKLVVTKANAANIWSNLQQAVLDGGSSQADRKTTAEEIVDILYTKDAGASSWGVRLLKFAWNGKGL